MRVVITFSVDVGTIKSELIKILAAVFFLSMLPSHGTCRITKNEPSKTKEAVTETIII